MLGAVSRGENPEDKVVEPVRVKQQVRIEKVDRIVLDDEKNKSTEETPEA